MCPASVGRSRASRALETGEAKLWVLLVGVNQYEDEQLPTLSYPALDCQGLGEAIAIATQTFPQKTVLIHHDFAGRVLAGQAQAPKNNILDQASSNPIEFSQHYSLPDQIAAIGRMPLETIAKLRCFPGKLPRVAQVRASLQQIVLEAKPQDTVLFYFSGHGLLESQTQQAVLCLSDTRKDNLLKTGLGVQELLTLLANCAAHQQIVWLDACHSGGMTFRTAKGEQETALPSPTLQLMELLRQRAAQSKGFYALLSCDHNQQSWEFPELGHGVFTYYLMRGLLGEAADAEGVIEADCLYKYVYYQTLRYIDKTNQQLRLINQQKRGRGETQLQPEYPLQTPKRIVEGIGELILGVKPDACDRSYPRQALVIDGLTNNSITLELSKVLRHEGCFELSYFPQPGKEWASVREAIQTSLRSNPSEQRDKGIEDEATVLLYLRGKTRQSEAGDARMVLKDGVEISRSWLRQELRRSPIPRQVVILDCPSATDLNEWIEDLQTVSERGQYLIAAAAPEKEPDRFTQVLLNTLAVVDAQAGLSIAGWIAQMQAPLLELGIMPHLWLSGSQGVIEVLPGKLNGRGNEVATGLDLGVCPYLGLRAFAEDDAPFFFGRENLTQQLINVVSQQSFLAVIGASGSGKSSVVQAGLMAQLRQGNQLAGSEQWWMRVMRPGAHPLDALVQRLADGSNDTERKYQQLQLEGILHLGVEGFVHWLRSRPEPMIVLVVDQFEELFTLAAAEDRQRVLDLLMGGLEHAGDRFKLVITLRTDFIAPCLEYPALAQILQQSSVLVPPVLNEDAYRQVILQPAEKVGLKVEAELMEVLLQELSHMAGDLPLLEFVLEQLWEQRQPGELTLQVYQQQIGGLKGALERKAQTVYDNLNAIEQECARWIFLSLTQLGEGTEDTRRRIYKSDLIVKKYSTELIDRTLQALTAAKLVIVATDDDIANQIEGQEQQSKGTPDQDSSPSPLLSSSPFHITIEVAHEILIRHWSTLRWWLEENRTRLRTLRQIEQAANQWQQSGQQPDFLLRGVRLDAAEEIYVQYTDELSQDVQLFIEAGLQARQQEQQQAKRRLKRAQVAVALIGTLGIAATGLGGIAYVQRQRTLFSEVATLNALSESQWLAHQQLEALNTSIRANRQLEQINGIGISANAATTLRMQTIATLQQAVEQTQELNRLEGHSQQVNTVNTNVDGSLIASGSDDATVRLWKPDGTLVNTFNTPDRVTAVAFSPDGNTLAAATVDGSVTLLNPENGEVRSILNAGNWVTSVAFHPNGQLLATGSRDRTIKLWNLSTGSLIKTISGHTGWVNQIQFSPDGRSLASVSEDKTIKLWNLQGQLMRTFTGHQDAVNALAFSPDGRSLASGSSDRTVRLWNVNSGGVQVLSRREEGDRSHGDRVTSVQFSPDGTMLLSASADQTMRFWELDGSLLQTITLPATAVLSTALTSDGKTLISAGTDTVVRLWDVTAKPHSNHAIYLASFSADHQLFASLGQDGQIQLKQFNDAQTSQSIRTIDTQSLPISAIELSPVDRTLVTATDDGKIQFWHPDGGTQNNTLQGHTARIASLKFSPNGRLLASGSDDKSIHLWDINNGTSIATSIATLTGHQDGITSLAFSPDNQIIASGSYDSTIKLWDDKGALLRSLEGHGAPVTQVIFSPDGQLLASASYDNTIKLWRVSDGTLLHTLTEHQDGVISLAFSPDSNILASGSVDRTIKLWNPVEGTLTKTLLGASDTVSNLNFSADGQTLFTVTGLGITPWSLNREELLQQGCDRVENFLKSNQLCG